MVIGLVTVTVQVAPFWGLIVKVTLPPSTGSILLFAVTVTDNGLVKAWLMIALCGVLPETVVRVKPCDSNAPISTLPTLPRPRWSAVGAPLLVPASIAGLPGNKAIVCVGLPLFCRPLGSSSGLSGDAAVPVKSVLPYPLLPSVLPIRLLPSDVTRPDKSGPLPPAVFPAIIVFWQLKTPKSV